MFFFLSDARLDRFLFICQSFCKFILLYSKYCKNKSKLQTLTKTRSSIPICYLVIDINMASEVLQSMVESHIHED